jgi:hypothetical protein
MIGKKRCTRPFSHVNSLDCHSSGVTSEIRPERTCHVELRWTDRCVYIFQFFPFFNWPGDLKHLGSARRQADEYIAPGGKFFMFFMYLILHMNQVSQNILPKTQYQ